MRSKCEMHLRPSLERRAYIFWSSSKTSTSEQAAGSPRNTGVSSELCLRPNLPLTPPTVLLAVMSSPHRSHYVPPPPNTSLTSSPLSSEDGQKPVSIPNFPTAPLHRPPTPVASVLLDQATTRHGPNNVGIYHHTQASNLMICVAHGFRSQPLDRVRHLQCLRRGTGRLGGAATL